MTKRNIKIFTTIIVCVFFFSCITCGAVFGKESSLEERVKALEESLKEMQLQATRTQDVLDIMYLQSRYVNVHNSNESLSWMLFADRPDTTQEITHTRLIGFDNIKKSYLEGPGAVLKSGNLPEGTIIGWTGFGNAEGAEGGSGFPTGATMGTPPEGMGGMRIHPTSSPAIVVAGDGKTAKATFHSLGFEGTGWCYGIYANDYIKIDGKWYIWHMKWLRCFKTAWNKSFVDQTLDEIYEFTQGETDEWGFPKVNPGIDYSYLYAPGKKVETIPAPKPYETWTDAEEGWWKREVTEP